MRPEIKRKVEKVAKEKVKVRARVEVKVRPEHWKSSRIKRQEQLLT